MIGVGEARLRRILAVVDLLIDAVDEDTVLPALLPLLLNALPADSLVWAPWPDPARQPLTLPGDLVSEEAVRAFARGAALDPLVRHTTRSGEPMRRSTLQTRREFHRLPAYPEVYHPAGAEYQLAMAFPAGHVNGGPRSICLAVNRRRYDFSEVDVAVAVLLRSRLSRALFRLSPPPPPHRPEGITDREGAVLDLLARGLTDQQIGRRLGVSSRTVDKHLEHAYVKLRVHGRVEAALTWLAARQEVPTTG